MLSEKHVATLMLQQKVITDCFNFYIFPIRKRVEFDPEALERVVHRDCWAINTNSNKRQKIEINSDSFVEPTSFKKELMKKNGLYSHCTRYAESLQEMKVLFDLSEEF
jgi:hypothetical protein